MRRLVAAWGLAWLGGCDSLFHIDTVVPPGPDALVDAPACLGTPRQEVRLGETNANTLHVPINATEAGNTLVLVAAIATTSYNIQTLVDSAGNMWHQAVTVQTPGTATAALDIWYTTNAAPITTIDATLSQMALRSMDVSVTEWRCAAAMTFDGAAFDPGASSPSMTATTGSFTTAGYDLVIGAVVFSAASEMPAAPSPAEFTQLQPFGTSSSVGGRAAYAWTPASTYQLQWGLDTSLTWVGGIFALKAQ